MTWLLFLVRVLHALTAGKGNASQASGSPSRNGHCGTRGPVGMRCDQPPAHAGVRHEHDGYGWWTP